MRYPVIVVLSFLMWPAPLLHAQTVNEVTLSAGFFSRYHGQELREGSTIITGPSGLPYKRTDIKDAGAYFISFQRWLVPQFTIGFTMGAEQENGSFEEFAGIQSGEYHKRSLSIAMEVRYYYLRRGPLRIYSMAGIGTHFYQQLTSFNYNLNGTTVILDSRDERTIGATYQVSPLGIRYGRRLGGFLEAGYGYKGIVNAGVALRF